MPGLRADAAVKGRKYCVRHGLPLQPVDIMIVTAISYSNARYHDEAHGKHDVGNVSSLSIQAPEFTPKVYIDYVDWYRLSRCPVHVHGQSGMQMDDPGNVGY